MPRNMNLPNPKYPLPTRADRAAARADAKRRKAVVLEVIDDGEFVKVQWVRDNGEKVSATFSLIGWGRAPQAVTERTLEVLSDPLYEFLSSSSGLVGSTIMRAAVLRAAYQLRQAGLRR